MGSTPTVGTTSTGTFYLYLYLDLTGISAPPEDPISALRYTTRMIDVEALARERATDYILQQYHLASLEEARRRLTPSQFESLLRDIDAVQRQILAPPQPQPAAPTTGAGRARGINTPFGPVLPATGALLVIIWLVFGLELLLIGGSPDPARQNDVLFTLGATTPDLFQTHQYWRLLAACFLHIGFLHIASNSIALIVLGALAERFYGPLRFLGIYLATGVIGAAVGVALQGGGAGASGAIMGLLGALLVGAFRNRRVIGAEMSRRIFSSFAVMLVLNLVTGFIPGIGWGAHAGGAAAGALLALLIPFRSPRYSPALNRAAASLSVVLIAASLVPLLSYPFAH